MSQILIYLPVILAVAGILAAMFFAWRTRQWSYLLVAGAFLGHGLSHLFGLLSAARFVQEQVGENLWTAPVVHVDIVVEAVFICVLLATVAMGLVAARSHAKSGSWGD